MFKIFKVLDSGELQLYGSAMLQFTTREEAEADAERIRNRFEGYGDAPELEIYWTDREGRIDRDPVERAARDL